MSEGLFGCLNASVWPIPARKSVSARHADLGGEHELALRHCVEHRFGPLRFGTEIRNQSASL